MGDCLPAHITTLTDDERRAAACDWSDFRNDYGVSADAHVLKAEHRAFIAGWAVHRNLKESPMPDQKNTAPAWVTTTLTAVVIGSICAVVLSGAAWVVALIVGSVLR